MPHNTPYPFLGRERRKRPGLTLNLNRLLFLALLVRLNCSEISKQNCVSLPVVGVWLPIRTFKAYLSIKGNFHINRAQNLKQAGYK